MFKNNLKFIYNYPCEYIGIQILKYDNKTETINL